MKPLQLLVLTVMVAVAAGLSSTRLQAQATPQAPKLADPGQTNVFRFNGGNLADFLTQIKQHFGVDLREQADIPNHMIYFVRVPKMRLQATRFENVLGLYNQLSTRGDQSLGRWIWIQDEAQKDGFPSAMVLVPPTNSEKEGTQRLTVRAFSLQGINTSDRQTLGRMIDEERDRLDRIIRSDGLSGVVGRYQIAGEYRFHQDSEILVASGGNTYVEMVQSLIEVFRERSVKPPVPSPRP